MLIERAITVFSILTCPYVFLFKLQNFLQAANPKDNLNTYKSCRTSGSRFITICTHTFDEIFYLLTFLTAGRLTLYNYKVKMLGLFINAFFFFYKTAVINVSLIPLISEKLNR